MSTGSEICFLKFLYENILVNIEDNSQTAYLNQVDHLLRLIFPALVGHITNLFSEKLEFVLPRPVSVLQRDLLRTICEPCLALCSRFLNHVREAILITTQALKKLRFKGTEA